jgi:hypothetical protein
MFSSLSYAYKYNMKVIYIGSHKEQNAWRGDDDPAPLLTKGEVYKVKKWDELPWHTHVQLMGIKGIFNSVCFKKLTE